NGAESSSSWSWAEDKAFETALVIYPDGTADRWEKIAASVQGKTVAEVKIHYALLVEDVNAIEADLIEVPSYSSSASTMKHSGSAKSNAKKA
ncbi:unnamed protein product, partial [Ilex paraguariensis]